MAVLPGASLTDVGQVGERILRAVQSMTTMGGEQLIKVTVSLGGVSHPELHVESEEALICQADSLFNRAKESGKNKIALDQSR